LQIIKKFLYDKSKIEYWSLQQRDTTTPLPQNTPIFFAAKASFLFIIKMLFPQHYPYMYLKIMREISEKKCYNYEVIRFS